MPTRAPSGSASSEACVVRHERVERVLALQHGDDVEPVRELRRDVLHRVHGEVRLAVEHRALELLDEQALAAERRQRPVEPAVAGGRHRHELDRARGVGTVQPVAHVLGLPQRERALARRDAQGRVGGRIFHAR